MNWFEVALQNPADNWPIWLILLWLILQTANALLRLINSLSNNSTRVQTGNQAIIAQDNSLQGKMIDFMAGLQKEIIDRRISDEKHKTRLADIIDEKITRIDKTTIDTHGDAKAILSYMLEQQKQMRMTQQALKAIYLNLKKEGVIQ